MPDEGRAREIIDFVSMLKHTGDFFGRPFAPLDWQKQVLSDVYGTVRENGRRQYHTAYLEIPKKNGKTELVAALAIYHLLLDPPGGQIFCCAAEHKQAQLVYKAAKDMIGQSKALTRALKVRDSTKEIINGQKHSTLAVLSAEAYSKHGLNPSVIIFDELHAQKKRDLWDTMTFGSGAAREEQLLWVITTAGDDPDRNTIGWEIHDKALKVLSGEIEDKTFYARVYTAPEDADIFDPAVWYAANPSLGVTIDIEAVRQEALQARNSPAAEKLFRWLRLNQWVALKRTGWLPLTLWDQTLGTWTRAELLRRDCYVGIDLSSTTDLTAAACVFPPRKPGEPWKFFLDAWIPADNMALREKRDHVPFAAWVREGYVRATPGPGVDYTYIANHLDRLLLDYRVRYICADKWRLDSLAALMREKVVAERVITIPQTIAGMSPAMKEFERLCLDKKIEHEDNPCGRWAFGNVCVAMDGNENIKPMKNRSIERIDPIVALINALAGALKMEPARSVYETRAPRAITW